MNCSRQVPLSMEFSRQDYWSGLPFPSPPSPWCCRGCCNLVLLEAARLDGALCWSDVSKSLSREFQHVQETRDNAVKCTIVCPRTGSPLSGWALWLWQSHWSKNPPSQSPPESSLCLTKLIFQADRKSWPRLEIIFTLLWEQGGDRIDPQKRHHSRLWGQGYYLVYLYSIPHIGGSCLSLVQHSICNKGLNSGATNSSYGDIQLRSPSSTEYSGNVHNLRGFGSLAGDLRNESQERLLRLSFSLQPTNRCM